MRQIFGAASVCFKGKNYGTKSATSRLRVQVLDGKCPSSRAFCTVEPGGDAAPIAGLGKGTE